MRALRLDYLRSDTRVRAAGWALLAVGAVALLGVHHAATRTESRLEQLAERAASAATPVREPAPTTGGRERLVAELRTAHALAGRLATPWSALFDALEAAQVPGVRLTAVTPDAPAQTAAIGGEARDYVGVLNYVTKLERQPGLSRVHLVSHEARLPPSGGSVQFTVQVRWSSRSEDDPAMRPVASRSPAP